MTNLHADTIAPLRANRCARQIQSAWKEFQHHTQTSAARCLDSSRVRLMYAANNMERFPGRAASFGREFYPSLVRGRRLRYPLWDPSTGREASGKFKRCFSDRDFVALQPVEGAPAFVPWRLAPCQTLFARFPTLVFNTLIDSGLMIAPNAGVDLFDFMNLDRVLSLDAFMGVCADVSRMHAMKERGGAYLRDIKPENVCVSELPPHRLSIIDFQDALVFGDELAFLHTGHVRGTGVYLTEGLIQGIYAGPVEDRAAFARAADMYTLGLAFIAGSAEAASWLRFEATGNGRYKMQEERDPLPPGMMHAGNEAHFTPWIARHVYPAYWNDIRLLLSDPAAFAVKRCNPPSLLQMLRFRALSEPPVVKAQGTRTARGRKRPHSV